MKGLCFEPAVSLKNLNKEKPIEMEFHIGLKFVLLVNIAKTITNCANVVIHV